MSCAPDWGADEPGSSGADRTGPIEGWGNNTSWEVCKDLRDERVEQNAVKAPRRLDPNRGAGEFTKVAFVLPKLPSEPQSGDGLFGPVPLLLNDGEMKFPINLQENIDISK